MKPAASPALVARIDEATCIGCTLCIDACPFDAIVGAARRMHAVLPTLCTGCRLCVPPCPVDCIAMIPAGRAWSPQDARAARARRAARKRRLAAATNVESAQDGADATSDAGRAHRQAAVAAALARARARRATDRSGTP